MKFSFPLVCLSVNSVIGMVISGRGFKLNLCNSLISAIRSTLSSGVCLVDDLDVSFIPEAGF